MRTYEEISVVLSANASNLNLEGRVETLTFDSRSAKEKSLFFAMEGTHSDGHDFIQAAYELGCRAVVVHKEVVCPSDMTVFQVLNTRDAFAIASCEWHNHPSKKLKLIGVTGTNGKTTTTTLLFNLFTSLGFKCGLLSTVVNKIGNRDIVSTHTTPNAFDLNQLLDEMVVEGCAYCFMEVSSHAIHQARVLGLNFAGGVFTNITHDHLDYHNTFSEYISVKKAFFDSLQGDAFALTNVDDKNGMVMLQNTKAKTYTYGLTKMADYKGVVLENELTGLLLKINQYEVHSQLIGKFNASNLLAVFGVANLLGFQELEVLQAMSSLQSVDGRFQFFTSTEKVTVVVDYAHTPDALENVLKTIALFHKENQKVITLVGCGGDRDKDKRPEMAKIAQKFSTQVILTSDNPRTENPEVILQEMNAGIDVNLPIPVLMISDRKQAIQTASLLAQKGDIVLIAGKGHEKYQEIAGVKHPFDDFENAVHFFNKTKS